MALGDPQEVEFVKQYMKALKFEWEHATTDAARKQAASKADTLRSNAKLMGIDLSAYGEGVTLANTPGGNTINWNLLSTVGKAWAGLNPTDDVSKWKQSVGTGLVTNIAGWQDDYGTFADSAAFDTKLGGKMTIPKPGAISKPPVVGAPPVVSGSNVGTPVVTPQVVTPVVETPVVETPVLTASPVNSGMQASQALNTQQQKAQGTWNATQKPLEAPEEGMEWTLDDTGTWVQTAKPDPAVIDAVDNMAGDDSLLSAFLAQNPDVDPDNTQWDTATVDRFTNWADLEIQRRAQQAIIDQGSNYDPTKDPLWTGYESVLIARDNATKASLKTALDLKINAINQEKADVDANYTFQIAEIQNALNMANWASGQQLAASGVIMVGALSQALQSNEAEGINKIWLSVQERTNGLNKLARDITILTQDYADQGTLIDKTRIAEIGLQRLQLIQGNTKEVQAATLLVKSLQNQIAALNITAPATEKAARAATQQTTKEKNMQLAAWTAELAQNGITITQNADGTWDWEAGLSMQQKEDRNQYLFDQWYKVEGLKLDRAQLDATIAFNQFQEWATREGIKLDWANFEWTKVVDQYTMDHPTTTGSGSGNGTDTSETPYMEDKAGFTADMNILNNPNEVGTNNYQQAVLRVGLGSGGLLASDEAFLVALTGVAKGKTPSWLAKIIGVSVNGGMAGVLTAADEATVARLADITDEKSPARALELYVAWMIKHPPTGSTPFTAKNWNGAIASYCKDFGTQLGYSQADVLAAVTWLTANASKLFGGAS